MVFSSSVFLFIFLPITLIFYFISSAPLRNYVLLLVSLIFYSWGEPVFVFCIIVLVILNYIISTLLDNNSNLLIKRLLLCIALCMDFGVLFYFKYLTFVISNIHRIPGISIPQLNIVLPIGISFFSFQVVSYVIDVYRGDVKHQRNILIFSLYLMLFPQLIAGPIVRYKEIEKQIYNRTISLDGIYYGLKRFSIGLSKKVLIADICAQVSAMTFGTQTHGLINWVGSFAYTIQIYYDFSGYSDMAIGLGKVFGFGFPENFNYPYVSTSIKEFWRRWHMSLSTWFRDYLYIPLGGNRCGTYRTIRNTIIVFACTGIWHGAGWNYLIWGLWSVVFLVLEMGKWGQVVKKLPRGLAWLYCFLVVDFGWIFFNSETLSGALQYIKNMFIFSADDGAQLLFNINAEQIWAMVLGTIFMFPLYDRISRRIKHKVVLDICQITIAFITLVYVAGSSYSPFLYFRF